MREEISIEVVRRTTSAYEPQGTDGCCACQVTYVHMCTHNLFHRSKTFLRHLAIFVNGLSHRCKTESRRLSETQLVY